MENAINLDGSLIHVGGLLKAKSKKNKDLEDLEIRLLLGRDAEFVSCIELKIVADEQKYWKNIASWP